MNNSRLPLDRWCETHGRVSESHEANHPGCKGKISMIRENEERPYACKRCAANYKTLEDANNCRVCATQNLDIRIERENEKLEAETFNKSYIDGRFQPLAFYKQFSQEYKVIRPAGTNNICVYDNELGIWKENGEEYVEKFLSETFNDGFKRTYLQEEVAFIRGKTHAKVEFNKKENLIVVENGTLDIRKNILLENSPDYYLTIKIPIKYNSDATCPKISKFFSEVVNKEDVPNLEEIFGYCLLSGMPIHRLFYLVGGGGNGKTTFIDLMRNFLGEENIASASLQSLSKDRFAKTQLLGKLANLCDDLTSESIKYTGVVKQLTGNSPMSFEHKFGGYDNRKNSAKLIFTMNEVPDIADNTNAFFRRPVIINFPNVFEGKKDNKNMIKEITAPEELSGLLNLAVAGLNRLLEKGDFSNVQTTEEMRDRYIRLASPVKAFAMDCLASDPEGEIPKDEMYQAFIIYCKKKNYPTVANNVFAGKLKEAFQPLAETQSRRDIAGSDLKVRVHCWKGVKFVAKEE